MSTAADSKVIESVDKVEDKQLDIAGTTDSQQHHQQLEEVSTAVVDNAPADPTHLLDEPKAITDPAEANKTEEENTASAASATATESKPPSSPKRRLFVNPFGKSKKEEAAAPATAEEDAVAAAQPTTSTSTGSKKADEEKIALKKLNIGFGTLFSRTKPSQKQEEPLEAEAATISRNKENVISTELPQIEQLQPIETDIKVEDGTDKNINESEDQKEVSTVKESVNKTAGDVATEVAEASKEAGDNVAEQANAANAKRQSFIKRLFGKKKSDSPVPSTGATEVENTTEEATETAAEQQATASAGPSEESKKDSSVTEDATAAAITPVASISRPSSPLGRITELFSSKKHKKAKEASTTATNTDTDAVTVAAAAATQSSEQEQPQEIGAATAEEKEADSKSEETEQDENAAKNRVQDPDNAEMAAAPTPAAVVASA